MENKYSMTFDEYTKYKLVDPRDLPFKCREFESIEIIPPVITFKGGRESRWDVHRLLPPGWEKSLHCLLLECYQVTKTNSPVFLRWDESETPIERIVDISKEFITYKNAIGTEFEVVFFDDDWRDKP